MSDPAAAISITIDGQPVQAKDGSTILDNLRAIGKETPTLCYLENLTPVNACRVCMVEMEGSRTLVPACSRKVSPGMAISTNSERVRFARKLVLELLLSSVDMSLVNAETKAWIDEYGAKPARFGEEDELQSSHSDRDSSHPGHHHPPTGATETVRQPVKVDNDLYIRDYAKCILCYKCVEACGEDAQNTFAISVAGRGFNARISTEFNIPLTESACVYCGNCIGVCPTNALMFKSEYDMREAKKWDESKQTVTDTICPYCGVGCTLQLHVQDNRIVKALSPQDHDITNGHLCIKGRFGWEFVNQSESKSKSADGVL